MNKWLYTVLLLVAGSAAAETAGLENADCAQMKTYKERKACLAAQGKTEEDLRREREAVPVVVPAQETATVPSEETSATLIATAPVSTPTTQEPAERHLVGSDEADCNKVKDYRARQQCQQAKQKSKPQTEQPHGKTETPLAGRMAWQNDETPVSAILNSDVACERTDTRISDHQKITVSDASQDFDGRAVYLYLKVSKESATKEIPDYYVQEILPNTFVALLSDGTWIRLGKSGQWLDKATRVHRDTAYRVGFTLYPPSGVIVKGIACLDDVK